MKPTTKPANPRFSSGPCAKRPGWTLEALGDAALGRSHRAKVGKAKLKEVIDRSKAILGIPAEYVLGIVPASDTGAIEMAMWSMLGARGTEVLVWESFGKGWATDCKKQLKLADLTVKEAAYGEIVDLKSVDWKNDVVFTFNGTTSGVQSTEPRTGFPDNREGLAICDATSRRRSRCRDGFHEARCHHLELAESPRRRRRAWHAGVLAHVRWNA